MSSPTPAPIKISDHLYQLGTPFYPVYLSLGAQGMLIEGGTGGTAELIAAQVKMLGIEPERIAYMALTHTHADHIGAVPRLRQLWPHLKVMASPKAAAALAHPRHLEQFLPADRMISKILVGMGVIDELPPVLENYDFSVDVVLEEGARIGLGSGIEWHVLLTPGHSACHTSYYESKEQVLALGDMAGYFDPGREIIWPNYFSGLQDYCLSIQKLAILPARLAVLSHNGAVDLGARPFLEQALGATMEYHARLIERLASGEPQSDICQEQAAWVHSYAPIASVKAIEFLVGLLCKQSSRVVEQVAGAPLGWSAAPSLAAGA
ncbi:MAG: MBL fold metallo-hydrolase [Desulfarculaceae bacterium]|nr:MBL fold metallo-hydrolase [Desulfarculaceae bacterium]MCF8073615.1 MBL fold metallo-hydrolase [Desulfarculaceae bacterium]MCF8103153.1 MBL fold metallo-hydrolase [Desulfarculaceae bacterium]MCF8115669.1 MBL fold metallo-hydrolase [Desulfarculaceae bacterium]